MNRFDKDFHDSDPASGRPFCNGYPDGVWMIGIILSFISLGILSLIAFIGVSESRENDEIALKVSFILFCIFIALVTVSIWVSYIVLIIRRSALIISLSATLGILAFVGSIFGYVKSGDLDFTIVGTAVFTFFMILAWYCEGLREDKIIGSIQAEQAGYDNIQTS